MNKISTLYIDINYREDFDSLIYQITMNIILKNAKLNN